MDHDRITETLFLAPDPQGAMLTYFHETEGSRVGDVFQVGLNHDSLAGFRRVLEGELPLFENADRSLRLSREGGRAVLLFRTPVAPHRARLVLGGADLARLADVLTALTGGRKRPR